MASAPPQDLQGGAGSVEERLSEREQTLFKLPLHVNKVEVALLAHCHCSLLEECNGWDASDPPIWDSGQGQDGGCRVRI